MIEEAEGAEAISPGWWFDRGEGVGVGGVVSCVHHDWGRYYVFPQPQ